MTKNKLLIHISTGVTAIFVLLLYVKQDGFGLIEMEDMFPFDLKDEVYILIIQSFIIGVGMGVSLAWYCMYEAVDSENETLLDDEFINNQQEI